MSTGIYQAETVNLITLNNLFIEMTEKNCNQKCHYCYIEFPQYKKIIDYINIDSIKKTLSELNNTEIECIYLIGAEPMLHPNFNAILRLCLHKTNVCICTNASFINEKKARFFKKVENESTNEIIFNLTLVHYDEIKNDNIRYRGSFRDTLFAIKHLIKYEFNPIITITNYYNLAIAEIYNEFINLFDQYGFDMDTTNIHITPYIDKNSNFDEIVQQRYSSKLDCEYGRVLTTNGIYTCPFLANDYRGRCGNSFNDFKHNNSLETKFCNACKTATEQIFSINFDNFK